MPGGKHQGMTELQKIRYTRTPSDRDKKIETNQVNLLRNCPETGDPGAFKYAAFRVFRKRLTQGFP